MLQQQQELQLRSRASRWMACVLLLLLHGAIAAQPVSRRAVADDAVARTAMPSASIERESPTCRLAVSTIDSRTLEIEVTFPALPSERSEWTRIAADGMQFVAMPGINLPAYAREFGCGVARLEILDVESSEQLIAGVELGSLDDVALTNDTALDRRMVARLRPIAPRGLYPQSWASVEAAGRLNGRTLSVLQLQPYRYDVARRMVVSARRMRLRIHTTERVDARTTESFVSAFDVRDPKRTESSLMTATTAMTTAPDGFEYKVFVERDGVYRLTASDLAAAGIPVDQIDARTLKLYRDGIEQPLLVFDRGDNKLEIDPLVGEFVEFFGAKCRAKDVEKGSDLYFDQYATHSVYFLTWNGALGKRLVEESGAIQTERVDPAGDLTAQRASFTSTIHFEENNREVLLGNAQLNTLSDRFDRHIWGFVEPNEMKSFPTPLPHPDVLSHQPVHARVAIRSFLRKTTLLDSVGEKHTVEVFVDAFRTIETGVNAESMSILDNQINSSEQLDASEISPFGTNTISIVNRRSTDDDKLADIYLNWVEISYPRLYLATNDSLEFGVPAGIGARYATFRLRGFSSPDIRLYRRGISRISNLTFIRIPARLPGALDSFDIQFQAYVASEEEKFFAVAERDIARPIIVRDSVANLAASTNAADYLILVDDVTSNLGNLNDNAHPLRRFEAFKAKAGFSPKIVRVVDIYDEFNGGVVSPHAIKKFLAHAYHNWAKPPRYALIFGGGEATLPHRLTSISPELQRILAERSYVPSIMLQTIQYGATQCDYLLGCFDGSSTVQTNLFEGVRSTVRDDLLAEVIIGRVAINDIGDIGAYVGKLIEQVERNDMGEWRNRSLMIGGWERMQSDQVMDLTDTYLRNYSEPARFLAADLWEDTRYGLGPDRSIITKMTEGVGLVTYLGHGGGSQWETVAELIIPNATSLANRTRMAPILSMTCFTGSYSVDGCLIGKLMVSPNGGAIQAVGTPGFGWLRNNGLLAEAIFSVMHNPRYRTRTFGEIITIGKALYIGTQLRGFPDHVPTMASMFTIFGDPSIRIPYPDDTVRVVSGQSLAIPGALATASAALPFTATKAIAHFFDTTESSILGLAVEAQISGGQVTLRGTVPPSYDQPFIGLRLYATNDNGESVTGTVRMPTGANTVSTIRPVGTLAAGNDAVFEITHLGATQLDAIEMTLRYDAQQIFVNAPIAVTRAGGDVYRTAPISAAQVEPGAIIDVILPASTTGGPRITTFHVEGGADPAAFHRDGVDTTGQRYGPRAAFIVGQAVNESIRMSPTSTGPRLATTLFNWGDRDIANVAYRIEYDTAGTRLPLGNGSVSIRARDSIVIHTDVGVQLPKPRNVRVTLSPDETNHWSDSYLRNNEAVRVASLTAGMVRSGIGFSRDGSNASAFDVPGIFSATIDAAVARGDGLVLAEIDSVAPVTEQKWSTLGIGLSSFGGAAMRFRARDISPATQMNLSLFAVGEDAPPDDARIVGYDSTTRLWLAYPTSHAAGSRTFTATVGVSGLYAIARVVDVTGPRIKFSVEGQFFLDSAAVANDARFSAVLFDESGINPEGLHATLDGVDLVVGTDVVWLDSTITASSGSVRIQKPVSGGTHTICVTASDRVGNARSECTSFEVDGELALRMYGNFPNPFTSETFIAYEIRGASVVDELELKIFSTAGKLVRTFRFPTATTGETRGLYTGGTGEPSSIGYHEVWWDGTDDAGRDVANGVYFYRLRVKQDANEVEELGTLARLR